ncbi:APC family permease [Pseudonocardiaceae bacterium YIM PH 21723]|nr:APC family permease [Pseudonocardiaceae bacterium YIM PH 21723]
MPQEPGVEPGLARRLGVTDAVVIGMCAMIGAGVFAAFAPAARAAGSWLLAGLAIAAVVAYCNAMSTASLAARHPESGGVYTYGRRELNDTYGFLAGWSFLVGKTASCAAMALTIGSYLAPECGKRLAVAAVLALTAVNYRGVTKTAALARGLLGLTLVLLLASVAFALTGTDAQQSIVDGLARPIPVYGVLQAAGLLFFAFAGYARIATLAGEVRDPARTLRRAIPLALGLTIALYALVGIALLVALGPERLAQSVAPVVEAAGPNWLAILVRVGAAIACIGALLTLIAGVSRTGMAMAHGGDLPGWLGAVHPRFRVPHHAELAVGAVVIAIVLLTDLRGAIGFSSFGVLVYYAVANLAALRRFRRWYSVLGLAGCAILLVTLPVPAILAGAGVLAVGLLLRMIRGHA